MEQRKRSTRLVFPGSSMAGLLAFLVLLCLANCIAEQRFNTIRGNKYSNLVSKISGWRSQRGGSCTHKYGHSCWGGHGKRSSNSGLDLNTLRRLQNDENYRETRHDDTGESDTYALDAGSDQSDISKIMSENDNSETDPRTSPHQNAIPMLDGDDLYEMKIWQIIKRAAENNQL